MTPTPGPLPSSRDVELLALEGLLYSRHVVAGGHAMSVWTVDAESAFVCHAPDAPLPWLLYWPAYGERPYHCVWSADLLTILQLFEHVL